MSRTPRVSRRAALRAGGLALVTGLAGCSALAEAERQTVRIGEIDVLNHDDERQRIHVLVFDGGEAVYRDVVDAEAYDPGGPARGGTLSGYPTTPGEYELYAWTESQASDEWTHTELDPSKYATEGERTPCASITVIAGDRHERRKPLRVPIWSGVCSDE